MHVPDLGRLRQRIVPQFFVLTMVAAAGVSACAGNRVPPQWRPPAVVAQQSTHGGWISIAVVTGPGATSGTEPLIEGEFIAVDEAAFHVLTEAGLRSVPRASVQALTIVGYGNRAGTLAAWSVGGGLSVLSHGRFLLFTAPMWAIAGVAATRAEQRAGTWHDEDVARRFARFPQGLPPNLDPQSLGTLSPTADGSGEHR